MNEKPRVHSADFVITATAWPPKELPPLPEVCFCGRSNVGKSSLLNLIVNRRKLARVSSTPGRTQSINVFRMVLACGNERTQAHLVDLPGYGFAKVPLSVKKTWRPMMMSYFQENPRIRAAIVLLDLRRKPNTEDLELFEMLEDNNVPAIVVATKVDKVPKTQRPRELKVIAAELGLEDWRDIRVVSALTKEGADELVGDLWEVMKAKEREGKDEG